MNSLILEEKTKLYKEARSSKGLDYLILNFKLKNGQSAKIDNSIFNEQLN